MEYKFAYTRPLVRRGPTSVVFYTSLPWRSSGWLVFLYFPYAIPPSTCRFSSFFLVFYFDFLFVSFFVFPWVFFSIGFHRVSTFFGLLIFIFGVFSFPIFLLQVQYCCIHVEHYIHYTLNILYMHAELFSNTC